MKVIKIIVDKKPKNCTECLCCMDPECLFDVIFSDFRVMKDIGCPLEQFKDESEMGKAEQISHLICNFFGTSLEVVKQRTRKQEIKDIRHIIYWFLSNNKKTLHLNYSHIAQSFGQDHATLINARKRVLNYFETEPLYRENIIKLEKLIEPILKETIC